MSKVMLHNRHAKCITMCLARHACFTIHIDAPCSPETVGELGDNR